jgi:hypothetical protein
MKLLLMKNNKRREEALSEREMDRLYTQLLRAHVPDQQLARPAFPTLICLSGPGYAKTANAPAGSGVGRKAKQPPSPTQKRELV